MTPEFSEELLIDIISLVCHVPEPVFSDSDYPLTGYFHRHPHVLLVCKQWMRIATPVLYGTVIIHSDKQAQALDHALALDKSLGLHIKRLRVEGGYGLAMYRIIESAPHITHLFVSLSLSSSDDVSGLCRSLPKLNPNRVTIYDPGDFTNSQIHTLLEALLRCIPKWCNLKFFHFPYSFPIDRPVGQIYFYERRSALVADALRRARNLEVVSVGRNTLLSSDISTISLSQSLRRIEMRCTRHQVADSPLIKSLEDDDRLRGLITFEEQDTP